MLAKYKINVRLCINLLSLLLFSMGFCSKCCNYYRVDNDNHNEYFNSLPKLDISATIGYIRHLTNLDADLHMQSDVNFNFYDIHNFHADPEIADCFNENCFSANNCNKRVSVFFWTVKKM